MSTGAPDWGGKAVTVSAVEMSVGLRSAARLLVLRGREDVGLRRESVARDRPLDEHKPTTAMDALDQINNDPLCLACEKESSTGRGVLLTSHTCVLID
jgi:hypothetical protein